MTQELAGQGQVHQQPVVIARPGLQSHGAIIYQDCFQRAVEEILPVLALVILGLLVFGYLDWQNKRDLEKLWQAATVTDIQPKVTITDPELLAQVQSYNAGNTTTGPRLYAPAGTAWIRREQPFLVDGALIAEIPGNITVREGLTKWIYGVPAELVGEDGKRELKQVYVKLVWRDRVPGDEVVPGGGEGGAFQATWGVRDFEP